MPTSATKQMRRATSLLFNIFILLFFFCVSGCSGESALEFQTEGRKLMEQENPGGAAVFFKNALDKDPANFSIRFDLGKAYLKMGKLDQAKDEFKKCLLQQEDNLELHLEMAKLYTMTRSPQQALSHIEQIEQSQPPSPETRELAALNFLAQGELEDAEKALKEALAINPKYRSASATLIKTYLIQKRPQEAVELADALLEAEPDYVEALRLRAEIAMTSNDPDTAKKCYRKLIQIVPENPGPYYMLGTVLLTEGNIAEATEVRDDMRVRFQQPTFNQQSAFEYMLSGMIAYQEGDFRLASTMFQNSIDKTPSQDGYYRLALSLNRMGNMESALSALRRILDNNPRHAPAMQLTSQILLDQNRLDDAQIEVERLTAFYPENASAFYLLGTILNAKGDTEAALKALEKALAINPAMSEATMRRSSILMAEKRTSEAVDELSKAITFNSGNVAARTALFNYYIGKHDLKKAEETINQGLQELPTNALFLTLKASLHATKRENTLAMETLKQARKSDPDFLPALNLLLRMHMLVDRNEEALAACDDYLSRHPNSVDYLIISGALLDTLKRDDEARQRLEKANNLGSRDALVMLVRRELVKNQNVDKAEQYLVDKLKSDSSANIRSLLAEFYLNQKKPEQALALYDALPMAEEAEASLGKYRVFMNQKKYDEALAQAKKIMKIDPESPLGSILISSTLEQSGKPDKAFEELESAYRRLQLPQLLVSIGNLCLRTEQYEKAESYFRTALRKKPNDIQALVGEASILMRKKQFSGAVVNYEKALELAPKNLTLANNLAMALAEEGKNIDRAVDLATKTFVANPQEPVIIDTLAFCLLADKRVGEAIVILKNATAAHPDSAMLHFRYGVALLKNGQKNDGIASLKKSLELGDKDENFTEQEAAKKMIKNNN